MGEMECYTQTDRQTDRQTDGQEDEQAYYYMRRGGKVVKKKKKSYSAQLNWSARTHCLLGVHFQVVCLYLLFVLIYYRLV